MNICIMSSDKRYIKLRELLCKKGYTVELITDNKIPTCDVIILSVRNEYSDEELRYIFSQVSKEATVLCGNSERIKRFFSGCVIDYSINEDFLKANAYLTAEATVSLLHNLTEDSLYSKNIFIAGYGRIGKSLCKILSHLGASVHVYARRNEVKQLVEADGFCSSDLDDCVNCQIIINTVPSIIFTNDLICRIPNEAYLIDLASSPYGFENMQRVCIASGLPGKVLTNGASKVVLDTILCALSFTGKEHI